MTLRQLLLITSLTLMLILRSASDMSAQIHNVRQEARTARQEAEQAKRDVANARELEIESKRYETQLMNITKYAPLSPGAVPGRDYAGDPSLTASGEELVPGKTAAAGPNVPFGTRIYVEGLGWYVVQDRGSGVGPNDIDLATETRAEAIDFGQQRRLVIFEQAANNEEEGT